MTANKNLLIGKWKFVKAERHNGSEWEPTNHTKGMVWNFYPEYIGKEKAIGVIVESAPGVDPIKLNYTYNDSDRCLHIEVYTDPKTRIKDETDIYELRFADNSTISLELINQIGCPPPYLRYTLQRG